jgi:SAM-dependent methyltransferase
LTQPVETEYLNGAIENPYSCDFFDAIRAGSRSSAKVVAPLVLQLAQPRAVVDVGCGDGTWLAEFRELGVTDTTGLDGEYVDRRSLKIPQDQFISKDLSSPFELARAFDLALSLEVAEHLPERSAQGFVDSLTRLAPIILFSAAIPFQGGTRHLNEQWPEYWAKLFGRRGYVPVDCIRQKIWGNDQVEWWYRQNCLIYARNTLIETNATLRSAYEPTNLQSLGRVHPRQYLQAAQPRQPGIREASGMLAQAMRNAVLRRTKRRSVTG